MSRQAKQIPRGTYKGTIYSCNPTLVAGVSSVVVQVQQRKVAGIVSGTWDVGTPVVVMIEQVNQFGKTEIVQIKAIPKPEHKGLLS